MDAQDINNALYQHFANYEYKLNNTYVFAWESDFFAQSKSGYYVECEVKISRGDYFKDFEKDKHRLFKDVFAGKSHHIYRNVGWAQGDNLGIVRESYICLDRHQVDTTKPLIERNYGFYRKHNKPHMQKQYVVNDWDFRRISIRYKEFQNYAPVTGIRIKPITEILCPHQFYYVVPENLVKLEEVPKYAGLIYINENVIDKARVIKRAPYLHKRPMKMDSVLLKKYYNLWQYKVPHETKMAIRNNYSE